MYSVYWAKPKGKNASRGGAFFYNLRVLAGSFSLHSAIGGAYPFQLRWALVCTLTEGNLEGKGKHEHRQYADRGFSPVREQHEDSPARTS